MAKKDLESTRCIKTAWGKLIPEKDAYQYELRTISAWSANLFQLMRILNPSWEDRTRAICESGTMMNLSACSGGPGQTQNYLEAFYDEWNIAELVDRSGWLGSIWGDEGDEHEDLSGRVIQFTRDRVEKELDSCVFDIIGSEICNMSTALFTANFNIAASEEDGDGEVKNTMHVNMCEARGCGDRHCRIVAERRDKFGLPEQGMLDHMQDPTQPVHDTPRERMFKDGDGVRNGRYIQAFGEQKTLTEMYQWSSTYCWVSMILFPIIAIREMCDDDDEYERLLRIVFATAGKNSFMYKPQVAGIRDFLGVPREIDDNDPRIMGSYIKNILDCQMVPSEFEAFDEEGVTIKLKSWDFTARFELAPLDELVPSYEAEWNGAVKTLVSAEWSVWFEGVDDEDMYIQVGHKIDPHME